MWIELNQHARSCPEAVEGQVLLAQHRLGFPPCVRGFSLVADLLGLRLSLPVIVFESKSNLIHKGEEPWLEMHGTRNSLCILQLLGLGDLKKPWVSVSLFFEMRTTVSGPPTGFLMRQKG